MKKIFLLIITILFIFSCDNKNKYDQERYCKEYTKEARQWILDCIKNANPKSDEDPEDWIYACKNVAIEIYCPMVKTVFQHGSYNPCTEFNKELCNE